MIPAAPKWNHSPEELARLARGEAPSEGRSLLDRVTDGVFGAPVSAAYPKGLLTAEDYAQARKQGLLGVATGLLASSGRVVGQPAPTMAQALGAGLQGGQGAYQGALDQATGQRMQGLQLDAMQQKQAQAQAQARARQEIFQRFPPPEGDDPAAQAEWMQKVLPWFAQAGDHSTVATFTEYLKSVGAREKKEHALLRDDLGDRVAWRNPQTGEIVVEERKGQAPRDPNVGNEQREQRVFQRSQAMATQYERRTKDYAEIADKVGVVLASAQNPSAAGDLSLIFAYMKVLDPGSVVREGEFATAANTGSVDQTVVAQYNKILKGERLAPEVRADFVRRSLALAQSNRERLHMVKRQYDERATRAGLDPDDVTYDYFEGLGGIDSAPAAPAAAAGLSDEKRRAADAALGRTR